jgi:hypothetical protein
MAETHGQFLFHHPHNGELDTERRLRVPSYILARSRHSPTLSVISGILLSSCFFSLLLICKDSHSVCSASIRMSAIFCLLCSSVLHKKEWRVIGCFLCDPNPHGHNSSYINLPRLPYVHWEDLFVLTVPQNFLNLWRLCSDDHFLILMLESSQACREKIPGSGTVYSYGRGISHRAFCCGIDHAQAMLNLCSGERLWLLEIYSMPRI